jgi:hypothetical protein
MVLVNGSVTIADTQGVAGWDRALIARGRPQDLDRTQHMLEQAKATAGRLGAEGITREVAEFRTALAVTGR